MANEIFSAFNPPILDGTIPAFYMEDGVLRIKVPFEWNSSVAYGTGSGSASGVKMKIRSVYGRTSDFIEDGIVSETLSVNGKLSYATFVLDDTKGYIVGSFYKILLYYFNGDVNGTFSSTAIVKYTAKPTLTINKYNALNNTTGEELSGISQSEYYSGIYTNEEDPTEKVYSYSFIISTLDDSEIKEEWSVRDLVHNNAENNNDKSSFDVFLLTSALDEGILYKLKYSVTTINGLVEESLSYPVMKQKGLPVQFPIGIFPELNYENGYVDLKITEVEEEIEGGTKLVQLDTLSPGSYFISRSNSKNPNAYLIIHEFRVSARGDGYYEPYYFKDFIVEHGVTYNYRIQVYNKYGLYNDIEESKDFHNQASILVAFEHMFLYAKGKQLKIKYNPKVSSFKTNILENKIDTIGSKFPYMFRNGVVKYKEFPISGFISRLSDEEGLFIEHTENAPNRVKTAAEDNFGDYIDFYETNLTDRNIKKERDFKMQTLEWLDNGEAKLFKSPGEGNYIVRLMNNSLSPNDTLSRMLHTFSGTAYEVSDYTWKDLVKMEIIGKNDLFGESEGKGGIEKLESIELYYLLKEISSIANFLNNENSIVPNELSMEDKTLYLSPGDFDYNYFFNSRRLMNSKKYFFENTLNNENFIFRLEDLDLFYYTTLKIYKFNEESKEEVLYKTFNISSWLRETSLNKNAYEIYYKGSFLYFLSIDEENQEGIFFWPKLKILSLIFPIWGVNINGAEPNTEIKINNEEICIGSTGTYYVDPDVKINSFEVLFDTQKKQGILTYSYLDTNVPRERGATDYDSYISNNIELIPVLTFIGPRNNTLTVAEKGPAYNNNREEILNSTITQIAWAYFYLDESNASVSEISIKYILNGDPVEIALGPNRPSYYINDINLSSITIPSGVKCDICYTYEVFEKEDTI